MVFSRYSNLLLEELFFIQRVLNSTNYIKITISRGRMTVKGNYSSAGKIPSCPGINSDQRVLLFVLLFIMVTTNSYKFLV